MGSPDRFADFRLLVLDDPALQERLRSIHDWPEFADAAVGAAAEHGLPLTVDDVRSAGEAAKRSWFERWV